MDLDAARARKLALWSFVLGAGGLLTAIGGVGVVLALAGVACAAVALSWLHPWHPHDGHGWALSGLMFGIAALLAFPLLLATVVPRIVGAHRARQAHLCTGNLRSIAAAKQQWAASRDATNGTPVAVAEIDRLFPGGIPLCPAGGRYRMNPIGTYPSCSIPLHNHADEAPR